MPPRRASGDPLQHLDTEGPRRVYVIDGEERLLVDEALRLLKSKVLAARAADFNLDVFNGREAGITKILIAARTLPCFAENRLVIVKEADKIAADEQDALLAYLADPSPSTVLVLLAGDAQK